MAGTAEVTDFRHAADRRLLPDRRHFLLIQGPFGPFFRRLATALEAHGATVTKIHLNGCDVWDWGLRPGAVRYTGTPEGWSAWIAATLASRGVTDLVVYGDCQAYHRAAIEMARRSGVRVHVFEQGYLRPHWITLEEEGVNAYSRLPRDPAFFLAAPDAPAPAIAPTGNVTRAAVAKTIAANLALYAFSGLFPGYRNPYFCAPARQAVGHTRRYFRTRVGRRWRDARIAALIEESRPFYLALMQRPGDSQLTCHSDYHAADDFAEACIASFARHAPPNTRLVFKCHPLDPGLHDHVAMLDSLARKHDVTGRVIFVDGGVLADMLRKTNG
ncbi:MAG: hypothetical protein HXY25_03500, partial [Alphaproteobacteria bacterium]|nr:hypothetical protein [Alphaproteobacteria bacterium]